MRVNKELKEKSEAEFLKNFGNKLRDQLKYRGISIKQLAISANIDYSLASLYCSETNNIMPSAHNLYMICKVTHMDPLELFGMKSEDYELTDTKKEIIARLIDLSEDKAELLLKMFNAIDSNKKDN